MPTRLPDPFTHPGVAPGFLSAPLVDNEPLIQDELPNGEVLEVTTSTQFWSINITYPDLLDEEYRLISAAINKAKASDGVIQLALPQYLNLRVIGPTAPLSIAAGQVGNTLIIKNTNDLKGLPYVGDLLKLTNSHKVYKITSVDTDTTANTWTLGLYPSIAKVTDGTEKPIFNNILFNMKLINRGTITENLNADGLYENVSINLREAL